MSEIILNDEWDDWDQEFDYRVDYFKKMVDEDCAVVFYSILDAISTLDMSLQAPDIETYKKVIANGMGMFYRKLPVFRFANMHRNANVKHWSETFMHLEDMKQETGEELPF
jgi:hypothetical protein